MVEYDQTGAPPDHADLILVEAPANPLLTMPDLEAAVAHPAPVVCDATIATALRLRPLEHGCEVAIHSATKILAGHDDVLAGVTVTRDPELRDRLHTTRRLAGIVAPADTAWLVQRGLGTLEVRLARQEATARLLAERLAPHPAVETVRYPGFSFLVSFDVADGAAAERVEQRSARSRTRQASAERGRSSRRAIGGRAIASRRASSGSRPVSRTRMRSGQTSSTRSGTTEPWGRGAGRARRRPRRARSGPDDDRRGAGIARARVGRGRNRDVRAVCCRISRRLHGQRRYRRAMSFLFRKSVELPTAETALPGRDRPIVVARPHLVLDTPITPPFPDGFDRIVVGMGCFWGAERLFWQAPGVYTTAVGTPAASPRIRPTRRCASGRTGHTEVVLAVFDPAKTSYEDVASHLLGGTRPDAGHAPGERRRHPVPLGDLLARPAAVRRSRSRRATCTSGTPARRLRAITTDIHEAGPFFYAEDYHQQYLAANPNGYCGLGGTGVSCPVPATAASE